MRFFSTVVFCVGLLLPMASFSSSMSKANYLVEWPWGERQFLSLLRSGLLADELKNNKVLDAFEERWHRQLRTLVFMEFSVSRGIRFSLAANSTRQKEIEFTGWVFLVRRLTIKTKLDVIKSCEIAEFFGQNKVLDLKAITDSKSFPRLKRSCDSWSREVRMNLDQSNKL